MRKISRPFLKAAIAILCGSQGNCSDPNGFTAVEGFKILYSIPPEKILSVLFPGKQYKGVPINGQNLLPVLQEIIGSEDQSRKYRLGLSTVLWRQEPDSAPAGLAARYDVRRPYDGGWTVPWQPMEGLQRPASGGGDGTKWRDLTEVTDATKAATLLSLMRHRMPPPGDTEPVCVYDLRGVTPLLTFARAGAGEGVILRDISGRPRALWNAAFCDGGATGSCGSSAPCLAAAHPEGMRPQCFLKSDAFRAYPLLRLQSDFFNCEPGMPAQHGHVPPSPGAATPAGVFSPDAGSLRSSAASSPASSRFSSRSGSLAGMEPFPQGFPGGPDDIERMRRMLKQTGIGSPHPVYKR